MSLQDPIADMLNRIRNGQARAKKEVQMPSSTLKVAIATILKEEGYIGEFQARQEGAKKTLVIELKYFNGRPVIETLVRYSRPGLRRYRSRSEVPKVLGGLGTTIVSTSRGIMTDKTARQHGVGGEVLCFVS
ncbi:MAG: 30S ribosomal protein S8 [Gammaproteobacteria bacterium RIFCSPLOWO2_02_FULL_56_15]|nr:MAG: 30S ribosomal protein S8 [Gammaproteobacteria bacterium RIFCSPLOWO2_02_FULL_56_15]